MGCGNNKNRRILYRITASNVKQHVLSVNKPFYDCIKKDDFSINLQNHIPRHILQHRVCYYIMKKVALTNTSLVSTLH